MDLGLVQTIGGVIVNIISLAYIAVRVEHRLTKMETHIQHILLVGINKKEGN